MKIDTKVLSTIIRDMGYPDRAYSIGADAGLSGRDNVWCIVPENGKWVVFYSERGDRWDEESFDSEHLACTYFLGTFAARYFLQGPPRDPQP